VQWKVLSVGNVVPPDTLREAAFSYTARLDCVNTENIRMMVTFIGALVSRADFSLPACVFRHVSLNDRFRPGQVLIDGAFSETGNPAIPTFREAGLLGTWLESLNYRVCGALRIYTSA
jgi:hypothetical protein